MLIFRGRDRPDTFRGQKIKGYISTGQIQRLLDEAAERAGLHETRLDKARQRKRVAPHLLRHSFSRWKLDAGIDILVTLNNSRAILR